MTLHLNHEPGQRNAIKAPGFAEKRRCKRWESHRGQKIYLAPVLSTSSAGILRVKLDNAAALACNRPWAHGSCLVGVGSDELTIEKELRGDFDAFDKGQ